MPVSHFIGREREQEIYRSFLRADSQWVLEVTGLGGSGKSRLLRWFRELQNSIPGQEPFSSVIIEYNFAAEALHIDKETHQALPIDALTIISTLAGQVKPYCDQHQYTLFMETLEKWRIHLVNQNAQIFQFMNANNQSEMAGGRLSVSINDYDVRVRQAQQIARDSSVEAFYALMDTLKPDHLSIMLDTCEWLNEPVNSEVGPWIINTFLLQLHIRMRQQQKKCQVVVASSVPIRLPNIAEDEHEKLELAELEEEAVKQHLYNLGVQDLQLQHSIYEITHGHAACFAIICELWSKTKIKPTGAADILEFRRTFNERAERKFIDKHILDERIKYPLDKMTRYSVLLRSFDHPLLKTFFSDLPAFREDTEEHKEDALKYFTRFIERLYVEDLGRQRYTLIPLLREVLPESIRRQEPEKWVLYHERALTSLQSTNRKNVSISSDMYYHRVAIELTYDEEQNMEHWQDKLDAARNLGAEYDIMLEVAKDNTLMFTSFARAAKAQV